MAELKLSDKLPGEWAIKTPKTDEEKCLTCSAEEKKKKEQEEACYTKLKGYGKLGSMGGTMVGGPLGSAMGWGVGGMLALGSSDCQFALQGMGAPGSTFSPSSWDPVTGKVTPAHFK